jgi:hypothetical protein
MAGTDSAVAIYWDFENVHACLLDAAGGGESTYHKTGHKPQAVVVDIARVVEYAATLGRVVVHRAYANWQFFANYRHDLQAHAIDTVQLFPLTVSKNGADIRLAIDAVEDLHAHPHITDVVVVASDSDYTALAQRCRTRGRRFVGVTAAHTARGYLHACDEVRRYHDLPASSGFVPPLMLAQAAVTRVKRDATTLEDAAALVVEAITRLAGGSGEPWVLKARVRPMVKRLDPDFDESSLGFTSFSVLVDALGGRIAERHGISDHELAVRADLAAPDLAAPGLPGAAPEAAVPSGWLNPVVPLDPPAPAVADRPDTADRVLIAERTDEAGHTVEADHVVELANWESAA